MFNSAGKSLKMRLIKGTIDSEQVPVRTGHFTLFNEYLSGAENHANSLIMNA